MAARVMMSYLTCHNPLFNPWESVHSTYLNLWTVQLHGFTRTCSPDEAFTELKYRRPELTFTSVCQEEKLSTDRTHWTSTERGSMWENKEIWWQKAQLRSVVNYLKDGERGACCCRRKTEQRTNDSNLGRTGAAEAGCEEAVGAVMRFMFQECCGVPLLF